MLDPFVPICPYFLHGKCKEADCEFQHPGAALGFQSAPLQVHQPVVPADMATTSSTTGASELPEYCALQQQRDAATKFGLVVRTWCRACRCFVAVTTQHLRSEKRCTECVARAGKSESAWLTVLHHVLCRADALRLAGTEPSAAQAELVSGMDLADRALATLPESSRLIQHSLVFRRVACCQEVPLTLLKTLLMRTRRVCLLWQCEDLVDASVWPQLLRFTIRLQHLRFDSEGERMALLLAFLHVEETTQGCPLVVRLLRELLQRDSCEQWPLMEQVTEQQRAALWLCTAHVTVHGQLPALDAKYGLDLSQMEATGYLMAAGTEASAALKEVLSAALEDCFGVQNNVMRLNDAPAGGRCSALQLLTCVLWEAGLAPPNLSSRLPLAWGTTLLRWAAAHNSEQQQQQPLHDIVVCWCRAEQAAFRAEWALTVNTLEQLGCSLVANIPSDTSVMLVLAYVLCLQKTGPQSSQRNWKRRTSLADLSPSYRALLCAVPLLLRRAYLELDKVVEAADVLANLSVEKLRSCALTAGQEYALFSAAVLRWWCPQMKDGSGVQYDDLVRSAWRSAAVGSCAGEIVSVVRAARAEQLSSVAVRHELAEDVLKRVSGNGMLSVLCLGALLDWLVAQDGSAATVLFLRARTAVHCASCLRRCRRPLAEDR